MVMGFRNVWGNWIGRILGLFSSEESEVEFQLEISDCG